MGIRAEPLAFPILIEALDFRDDLLRIARLEWIERVERSILNLSFQQPIEPGRCDAKPRLADMLG
jgi:hypothetical protein